MRPENYNCSANMQNYPGGYYPAAFRPPMPPTKRSCCCKKSMAEALRLLFDDELERYIDFYKFAFLSPTFLVGSKLILIELGNDTKDNLAELSGQFKRFSVGNCDTIDISGTAVYNIPIPFSLIELKETIIEFLEKICDILKETDSAGTLLAIFEEILMLLQIKEFSEAVLKAILDFLINWFTVLPQVDQASLCELQTVAFELKYKADFDIAAALLQENLENTQTEYSGCKGHCDCDDCCCNTGIKFGLLSANASHTVTLTAGNLILREVKVLGNIGNVLVFGNAREGRFYFVCADSVEFLG